MRKRQHCGATQTTSFRPASLTPPHCAYLFAGLVAQQQCCGPLQLPVADVAVTAQTHFGLTGAATAIGEQPLKGLIDPAAMARLALGEALTNLVSPSVSMASDDMWAFENCPLNGP